MLFFPLVEYCEAENFRNPMIYGIFNDLADIANKLTVDHLLCAGDVKLTTPRKQAAAIQSTFSDSSNMPGGWELIFNPSKINTCPLDRTPVP